MQLTNVGKITSYVGGLATIKLVDGSILKAKAKGIFRHDKHEYKPMVGDNVLVQKVRDDYVISEILERKNSLIRPKVANIDEVIIVQSVVQPDLNTFMLNKYLAFYESRIETVKIAFTKTDLLNEQQKKSFLDIKQIYQHDGYEVYDLQNETDFTRFKDELASKTVCLVGNSGVGKSTLLNRIDPNLALRTQEISQALNRGKHTTTNVGIIDYGHGQLIDTPGFSSLDTNLTKHELANSFHDFHKIAPTCKFSNCLHVNEPGCAIKKAVESQQISQLRYDDYLRLLKETKNVF